MSDEEFERTRAELIQEIQEAMEPFLYQIVHTSASARSEMLERVRLHFAETTGEPVLVQWDGDGTNLKVSWPVIKPL